MFAKTPRLLKSRQLSRLKLPSFKRRSKKSKGEISNAVKKILAPQLSGLSKIHKEKLLDRVILRWRIALHKLLPLGGASGKKTFVHADVKEGNYVEIYNSGKNAFESM